MGSFPKKRPFQKAEEFLKKFFGFFCIRNLFLGAILLAERRGRVSLTASAGRRAGFVEGEPGSRAERRLPFRFY
jgi:hypothetical protein